MKPKLASIHLSCLAAACALAFPLAAEAGTVGHYNPCQLATVGDFSGPIAAAGHTKVTVNALDAGSLNGLSALVITECYSGQFNAPHPALNNAVANGMGLVFERLLGFGIQGYHNIGMTSTSLPGAPTFSTTNNTAFPEADDILIEAGAPIASGPGGTLTQTSLDRPVPNIEGTYNMAHWYLRSSLPAGAIPFITTADVNHVGGFGYSVGAGRVVFTDTQFSLFLPGGSQVGAEAFGPGGVVYLTNAIAWVAGTSGGSTTTCATEGYTGAKLVWCKKICEDGLTGRVLDTWIHRWISQYRTLPYCAVGGSSNPT